MSGWTTVGHCPHCGAPIYTDLIWNGITPPPNRYSCSCASHMQKTTTTDGTWHTEYGLPSGLVDRFNREIGDLQIQLRELRKDVANELSKLRSGR